MEMFLEPVWQIEERFTKSELGILAWRSQETYHQTMSKMKTNDYQGTAELPTPGKRREIPGAHIPEGLPDHFFNEEGDLDLRGVTAKEAWKFFDINGIHLPVIQR